MSSTRSELLLMIRLLHGQLSGTEGVEMRRRLAESLELARQYRCLMETVHSTQTAHDLLHVPSDVSADDVSSFIDGTMCADEEERFVAACWKSPALLLELVSAYTYEPVAGSDATGNPANNRLERHALVMLGLPHAVTSSAPTLSRPAVEHQRRGTDSRQDTIGNRGDQPARRSSIGRIAAIFLTVAAVGLLLMFAKPLFFIDGTGRGRGEVPVVETPSLDRQPRSAEDPSGNRPPEPMSVNNNDSVAAMTPSTDIVNEVVPSSVPDSSESASDTVAGNSGSPLRHPDNLTLGSDRIDSPGGIGASGTGISDPVIRPAGRRIAEWHDVRGVIGLRDSSTSAWRGIYSRPTGAPASVSSTTIMTLSHSGVSAVLNSSERLIVDSDSMLTVSAAENSPGNLMTEVELRFGRFAMSGIAEGQKVSIRADKHFVVIETDDEDAVVGAERDGEDVLISVWRGTATSDDVQLTRRHWLRLTADGTVDAARAPADAEDWHRQRALPEVIPVSASRRLNASADMAATAAEPDPTAEPEFGFYMVQAALNLSAAERELVPEAIVRRAASSSVESHRQSVMTWLLATMQRHPGREAEVLQGVCRALEIDLRQQPELAEWFRAALSRQRPTVPQLTQLLEGLRPAKPLFVRQAAKFFLQQILTDPLTEYDPSAPADRAALSSIARKMRAWQQANQSK